MITLHPTERPWEHSNEFALSLHQAFAERIEERLRSELVGSSQIFVSREGEITPPLEVVADEQGVEVTATPPGPNQDELWRDRIRRTVGEEVSKPPLEKAKETVRRVDPLSVAEPMAGEQPQAL